MVRPMAGPEPCLLQVSERPEETGREPAAAPELDVQACPRAQQPELTACLRTHNNNYNLLLREG